MKPEQISISNSEKLGFYSNLATMVTAGITVFEATKSLAEDAKGNLKKILDVIIADGNQGQQLNISLAKFPQVFDKVTVSIIKAAENTGTVDVVLKDLKESIKKDIEFMDKVKAALTYPLVIMIVFVGVMVLMLTFVIPRISTVFLQLRVSLPLPTRILIYLSNLIVNNGVVVLAFIAIMTLILMWFYRTQKKLMMSFILGLPIVNNLAREIDLTRFSRSMYLLFNSGISITTSLKYASEIVTKKDVAQALLDTRELVTTGRPMSDGLKKRKEIFPSIMVKIIEAGERSGTIERSMAELAEHFEYEVTNQLRFLTALLEPLILVAVGVFIGGLMIAIIAPIYGLIGQVGAPR